MSSPGSEQPRNIYKHSTVASMSSPASEQPRNIYKFEQPMNFILSAVIIVTI